jgi:iron complex transport system substrate-binding protein
MNPCVDTVLQEIADPASIAGVSRYSQEPRSTSVPLAWARRYPGMSGTAEDVIAARPDLVIAGPHVSVQTIHALQRLGIPLLQLSPPESVAENKAQIMEIAARIGRVPQGEAVNRRIDAALARTRWTGPRVPALIWQGSGLVPGRGTLADALMTHAGFRNVSAEIGLKQWDILPIEGLLSHPPQVLLVGRADMGAGDGDANRMLSHPALKAARARIRQVDYASSLLHCGGPVMIRSLERLAQVRREVS